MSEYYFLQMGERTVLVGQAAKPQTLPSDTLEGAASSMLELPWQQQDCQKSPGGIPLHGLYRYVRS